MIAWHSYVSLPVVALRDASVRRRSSPPEWRTAEDRQTHSGGSSNAAKSATSASTSPFRGPPKCRNPNDVDANLLAGLFRELRGELGHPRAEHHTWRENSDVRHGVVAISRRVDRRSRRWNPAPLPVRIRRDHPGDEQREDKRSRRDAAHMTQVHHVSPAARCARTTSGFNS